MPNAPDLGGRRGRSDVGKGAGAFRSACGRHEPQGRQDHRDHQGALPGTCSTCWCSTTTRPNGAPQPLSEAARRQLEEGQRSGRQGRRQQQVLRRQVCPDLEHRQLDQGLSQMGCMAACHMGEPGKPYGNKYTGEQRRARRHLAHEVDPHRLHRPGRRSVPRPYPLRQGQGSRGWAQARPRRPAAAIPTSSWSTASPSSCTRTVRRQTRAAPII